MRALANDQTQNNIEKSSGPTTDNQKSSLDEKLRKKDKEITELRARLNNLNELKIKIKNNEISRLRNELDQTKISKQVRTLEDIEESSFFEPVEGRAK